MDVVDLARMVLQIVVEEMLQNANGQLALGFVEHDRTGLFADVPLDREAFLAAAGFFQRSEQLLRFSLEQDGMEVDCAYDGEEALNMAKANEYDMILLDIMLPKMDGFEVCQAIREFSDMPIVMLTAKGDDMDKILGLDYGADDYITKPFNILEVKARIKAIMRRTAGPREKKEVSSIVEKGDLRLDCDSRRLFISGREVNLTAKEFDLLELLVKNENKVYSRENLLGLVWGKDYPGDVRTVDVHVRRLREKIETNPSEPKYVHTKWGVGYYYYQK